MALTLEVDKCYVEGMKKLILFAFTFISLSAWADVHVRGYTKKNGTYVAPHYRSSPDSSFNNNWSTKGNTNPYTGKPGWKTRRGGGYSGGSSSGYHTYNNYNSYYADIKWRKEMRAMEVEQQQIRRNIAKLRKEIKALNPKAYTAW